MKTSNQKPIEYDIHLKYICKKCGDIHWLSFKEASTKNYKIVCDCNNVFKVKRVKDFKVKYHSILPKAKTQVVSTNSIPIDLLDDAVKYLATLGFTNSEAKNLVNKIYNEFPTNDVGLLVKKSLESLKNVK
jgi:Holliday junction resolvasome RuvABC DNA-binding subunit